MRRSLKQTAVYTCPFCNVEMKASGKTEIFYRNEWIKGCNECFALSIDKKSMSEFQERTYRLV